MRSLLDEARIPDTGRMALVEDWESLYDERDSDGGAVAIAMGGIGVIGMAMGSALTLLVQWVL